MMWSHWIAIVHLWLYYSWFPAGRPWQPIWPNEWQYKCSDYPDCLEFHGLKMLFLEKRMLLQIGFNPIAIVHLWWYYSWFSTGRPWQPIWPNCEGQIAGLQTHRRISISRKYGLTIQKKNQHLWRRRSGHHGRLLTNNGFE